MNAVKFIKQCTLMLIFIGVCFSCKESTPLEISLQEAKNNRQEMEKVLAFFSHSVKDSLKYRAACFLIENMPGHVTYSSEEMEQYYIKTIQYGNKKTWCESLLTRLLLPRFSYSPLEELRITEDIEVLSSDFLIAHIESTFRQKDSCIWLKNIDFDDFCEYLLPYRLDKESPMLWRDSLLIDMEKMNDFIKIYDDTRTSITNLSKILNNVIQINWSDLIKKMPIPMDQYTPDCLDNALSGLMLHRLCGIPAAIDMIPCWGNYNGHHTWVQPIEHKVRYLNQIEGFNKNIPKVYRRTYSKQFNYIPKQSDEYIPEFFQDPYLKDVTNEYVNGVCVEEIGFPLDFHYGYLCVFNQGKWMPVSQSINKSGQCVFPNMGPDILYLPGYFNSEELIPVSSPFILMSDGKKVYPQVTDRKDNIVLYRKYPMESRKRYHMKHLTASIEVSETELSQVCDTIYKIQNNPLMQPFTLNLNQKYHYFRISLTPNRSAHIAEIYFFNQKGRRIYGTMKGANFKGEFLNDGNILTSTWISDGISFSFSKTDTVASMCLLPYNDGNGIYPGDKYELFYFDKENKWVSCGKKNADSYKLEFEQMPLDALFWLRNLTCGKEERIFTFQNGKQYFW